MSHSVDALAFPEAKSIPAPKMESASAWKIGLVFAGALLVWWEVIAHLRAEWTVNPQYEYGWTVPFLAAYLFYLRWRDRPLPTAPRTRSLPVAIGIAAALPLLAARIISIANPDWRLLSWLLSAAAVLISFCCLYLLGGLAWTKHFGFCAAFVLVATPWPAHFEQTVVQTLMRADSAIVVQVLNMIGTIAIQRGNVIELSTGLVGIADACTGIRSLQSTLMISLFLGEYYRMSLARRGILVAAAATFAFVCNLGRTLILCLIASSSSVDAVHAWHDSAGYTILILCIFGLWMLSLWMSKGTPVATAPETHSGPAYVSLCWPLAFFLVIWVGITEITAAAWYGRGDAAAAQNTSWSVAWPSEQSGYAQANIPNDARDMLLYDDGGGATWKADGHNWLIYYFHWLPGRTAARFVKFHRPDVCLPASGMAMVADNGIKLSNVNGVRLPIRSYRFERDGFPIHIFYCYWDSRSSYETEAAANEEDWTARGRIHAAWRGRRELGAQMLELAVWGYSDDAAAAAALQEQLEGIVRRG